MPLIQTDSQHYSDIADAIRDMSGNEETFYPSEMAAGVRSIPQTIAIAPIIYSLEEREVGVWTDGKPLYQKTFRLTTYMVVTNHSWAISFSDLGLSNIDHIFYTEAREIRSNGTIIDLSYRDPQYSDGAILRVSPQNSNISYYTTLNGDAIQYLEFTLRYTKTTDTPGSGTWTPSGVPAHHYSTTEQVIGTWIDGSTLYEKTFEFSTSISVGSSWVNTGLTLMNVKYLIHCSGGRGLAVYNVMADMDGNNIELCIPGWSASIKYFTLQYTKTTD